MKKLIIVLMTLSFTTFYSCDVDKTQDGELPTVDVDIDADAGELPKFDVDWMNVNVGTTTKTVTVPTVEIVMEEKEVEVPFINAQWPSEFDDVQEQTVMVEAEVTGNEHKIDIREIYAKGDKLIVISKLEKTDKDIGDKAMRVNDQVVINAPDLTVKHYIIGERPARGFNNSYTYVANKNKIEDKLKGAHKIFG